MPTFLPVVEALWIFLMVCVTAYAAAYHGLMAWPAPSSVVAQAMALSVSAVVALYYNGLYDVRVAGALAQAQRQDRPAVDDLLRWRAAGMVIDHAADFYARLTGRLALEWLSPSALVFDGGIPVSRFGAAVRRAVSLVVAVVALALLAPALTLIALAIKLDSSGPVFFLQRRQGAGGRTFTLVKFRTMRPAAADGSEWARDNAQRITPLGKWLRRFRLDELPQFVNILRGDMNLVGPRPHPAS